MELISGGELFDRIVELEFYKESDAAHLAKQLVDAVAFCHSKNVVHRDLKPENLMFTSKDSDILKLIDFGVSAILENEYDLLRDKVGTQTYMAPEIERGDPYGKPSDLYSIGVILYILLAGYPPFDPDQGIFDLEFPSPDWDNISSNAIELLTNLLDSDPSKRVTIEELQAHRWITGETASNKNLNKTINTLQKYNTLRKVANSVNAGRSKRLSVFGIFHLEEEKKIAQEARGSIMLHEEDITRNLKQDLDGITERFDHCNEIIMKIGMRKEGEENRRFYFNQVQKLDIISEAFKTVKTQLVRTIE
eukprot:TRINITY_DN5103_c0_g1_i1.p1 TRINITY_DN5103_c0_g1~~TRINITY_DN5103_c0_g1_i1.p1  ORF type:complete len:306 (-),score=71.22 TRINITY_DN5103_c0_g1_i1:35-952(-)